MNRLLFIVVLCFCGRLMAQPVNAGGRTVVGINENWLFTREAYAVGHTTAVQWRPVQLPHTWNVEDVMDDEPGYYRGVGWYKKTIKANSAWQSQKVYLWFEGANQVTEVYINGQKAGEHTGGYTGFYIAISPYLLFDGKEHLNEIVVKVDNSYNEQIAPLTADFTFYGGLYRDVYVVAADAVHFTEADHGSSGVFITTPQVSAQRATVQLSATITNESTASRKVKVQTAIRDREGRLVKEISQLVNLAAGKEGECQLKFPSIANPHLWSPTEPYLYTVITTIVDAKTGAVLDQLTHPLGFRWFSFDADKGFILNGQPCKLVGASRHQDYQGLGNAVPDELALHDIQWLKEMGGNFLRIAHYPQDPSILEACDRLGILASVEIPVVNEITESDSFYNNCIRMQVEMIRQHFNHPAVIIWCYMNEVLLRPHFTNDKVRQEIYFNNIARLARRLDSTTRREDPSRYTMLVNHGDYNKYKAVGLTSIPMIIGWNLYQGWYGGALPDFAAFLDKHHRELPGRPFMVTEYGADADPRIRSLQPVRFDKSVEYATAFHRYYLQEMLKRPFVSGAVAWNLADFNSETREESMPHINNKGLLMWNRQPKDDYYYYKAILSTSPFVKIASGYWSIRTGIADSNESVCRQPVQVTSNLLEVELFSDGLSMGKKLVKDGVATWDFPFRNGGQVLTARGSTGEKVFTDQAVIDFQLQPYRFSDTAIPFQSINILLGAGRYYIDESRKQVWMTDQPYRSGSFGHIGGRPYKVPGNGRLPYGTDKNIIGSENDPVYQTQQTGIGAYRLDVPAGEYELTLHFAELSGSVAQSLPYNLSPGTKPGDLSNRIFDVSINGKLVLEHFNMARQYGVATAIARKVRVAVVGQEGLYIHFKPVTGEPVLNALQVKKLQ